MAARHTIIESPVGELTLIATDEGLAGVYFAGYDAQRYAAAFGPRVDSGFEAVAAQLDEYFRGVRTQFELPLAPQGNPFQQRVWDVLRRIPYGETRSYGYVARELGDSSLARDVGTAIGRNPIGIIVPCHRVIGADGKLVGFAGGLDRKRFLLDLEDAIAGEQLSLGGLSV